MKTRYMILTTLICLFTSPSIFATMSVLDKKPIRILHISLHKGCIEELEGVARALGLNLTSWCIHDLPPQFIDGVSVGSSIYNIGHTRAERIWNIHHAFFETFDAVITSDTAPLSRVFLQNGWKKPLIIWICNRFDYCDVSSLDCDFPDKEFYELFRAAHTQSNVKIIAYNEFEHYYAKDKGVETGNITITPCGLFNKDSTASLIPPHVIKENTFFLPPYHNETIFMNLSKNCSDIGINNYCGRYAGAIDLKEFKGIIHIPYAWSNLAFFENIKLGIPYFIPSLKFIKELAVMPNFFFPDISYLLNENLYHLTEWYSAKHTEVFTYFDSWADLQDKLLNADYPQLRQKIKLYAKDYEKKILSEWVDILSQLEENYR